MLRRPVKALRFVYGVTGVVVKKSPYSTGTVAGLSLEVFFTSAGFLPPAVSALLYISVVSGLAFAANGILSIPREKSGDRIAFKYAAGCLTGTFLATGLQSPSLHDAIRDVSRAILARSKASLNTSSLDGEMTLVPRPVCVTLFPRPGRSASISLRL